MSQLQARAPPEYTKQRGERQPMHKSKKHYGTGKAKMIRSHSDIPMGLLGHKEVKPKKMAKHIKAVRKGNIKAVKPIIHYERRFSSAAALLPQ